MASEISFTLRIDAKLLERARKVAARESRTLASLIRYAITLYIAEGKQQ